MAAKKKANHPPEPTPPVHAHDPVAELRSKLLALGGKRLDWRLDELGDEKTLARGELFPLAVDVEPGAEEVRVAVATTWGMSYPEYLIATGCALTDEGVWVEHTWLLSAEKYPPDNQSRILETAKEMEKYFGYPLTPRESVSFYIDHFLKFYCEWPLRLIRQMGGQNVLQSHGIILD